MGDPCPIADQIILTVASGRRTHETKVVHVMLWALDECPCKVIIFMPDSRLFERMPNGPWTFTQPLHSFQRVARLPDAEATCWALQTAVPAVTHG